MLVTLDRDLCQGHAVCASEAPEVFKLDDTGKVTALLEEVPPELQLKVRQAQKFCPTRAIRTRIS
jgi:sterol 14-demethylase